MNEKDIKILDRSHRFALRIVKMVRKIPEDGGAKILAH